MRSGEKGHREVQGIAKEIGCLGAGSESQDAHDKRPIRYNRSPTPMKLRRPEVRSPMERAPGSKLRFEGLTTYQLFTFFCWEICDIGLPF